MSSDLKRSFDLDAAGISLLSSSFFYPYVLLQIPAGIILDRFGLLRVTTVSIFFVGLGCFLFSYSQSLFWAVFSRIILGAGSSFAFVSLLKSIKAYFSNEQFVFVLGLGETFSTLAVAFVNSWSSRATTSWGWRPTMIIIGIFAWILCFLTFKAIKKGSNKGEDQSDKKDDFNFSVFKNLKEVVKNKHIWLCGVYCGFLFSLVTAFVSLWGVPFLQRSYGLGVVDATSCISMVYIGVGLASPLVAWLSRFTGQLFFMLIGVVSSLVCFSLVLYFGPFELFYLKLLIFFMGVSVSVYQLAFTVATDGLNKKIEGTAIGLVNMLCMVGAPLLQPIIGIILTLFVGEAFDGFEVYTAKQYKVALSVLTLGLFFSLFIAWYLIKTAKFKKSQIA